MKQPKHEWYYGVGNSKREQRLKAWRHAFNRKWNVGGTDKEDQICRARDPHLQHPPRIVPVVV